MTTDCEALGEMLARLESGEGAVLVAGKVHADLPTIQCVSHPEGARLHTDGEVRHAGLGLFLAKVGHKDIRFDGGGAMYRADTFSWCPLIASTDQLAAMGYDIEAAKAAIVELAENAPQGA